MQTNLLTLPTEILSHIFSLSPSGTPRPFSRTCHHLHTISHDPSSRAALLINRYGRPLSLFYAFKSNRSVLTPDVCRVLRAAGAGFPRFLMQLVDREYHAKRGTSDVAVSGKSSTNSVVVSNGVYFWFVGEAWRVYGESADFREDDVSRFERLVYNAFTGGDPSTHDAIRTLIHTFGYVPLKPTSTSLTTTSDELVYSLTRLDLHLLDALVRNGLEMSNELNNFIMERVICRSDISADMVAAYKSHGFKMSDSAIRKGLQSAQPFALAALRAHIPKDMLHRLAEDTMVEMLGPSSTRGPCFTSAAVDFLLAQFPISDECMARALFVHPPGDSKKNEQAKVHEFPATRSYFKSDPCPVWLWVLATYGASHPFTIACFDDALSRASGDPALHELHDVFLAAGVRFRPRHVKILACRVLHRDMAANSLGLIMKLRVQLLGSLIGNNCVERITRECSGDPAAVTDPVPATIMKLENIKYYQYPEDVDEYGNLMDWLKLLKDEIAGNKEWIERMNKTQLEGGPRGGMYRLAQPPEDGIKFLAEAGSIIDEANRTIATAIAQRRTSLSRGVSKKKNSILGSAISFFPSPPPSPSSGNGSV
ncbi:hypothetical protein HK096_003005 [Nowakowskiella sp. JEL0078]|nr:hypothetical protein HK096_003005 [Nowakowskiella sp. JEL0078]